jgi:membrane fusion protein, multidrug efflux system
MRATSPESRALRALLSTTALALLAAAAACEGGSDARAEAAAAAPAPTIVGRENVTVAAQDTIQAGPAISGALAPEREATVRAEVNGSVLETYVEAGQRVREGTPLARIEDVGVRDAFLSARSSVTAAQSSADVAERELARAERLLAAGAIAERDAEAARRANVAAQAALADAQARLVSANRQLNSTRVAAPFAGVVSERSVNAGDVVSLGTELFTVVDPSSMRLEASVPAEQLASVRVGAPVTFTVSGYQGRAFTGKVTRVNPVADPTTRQVRIIASVPNSGAQLVGGLFAEGRVASESRAGVVVPQAAVDERGVAPFAMRLKGGKVERVTVELGIRDASTETVEVRSGLAAGDTVLLGAAQGITPGTPAKVGTVVDQREQAPAAATPNR